ncbi:MAG: hypothetical protein FWC50_03900 [Planctomycetaceae bacterium]|nr:hypothetical protein [Planctomycetaceae bacterium]
MSKIDAKEELLGQMRKCPKCHNPILIQPANAANMALQTSRQEKPGQEKKTVVSNTETKQKTKPPEEILYDNLDGIAHVKVPDALDPHNKYFILGYDRLLAYWEVDKGWQYNVGSGFASARRNKDLIPNEGNYVFVEMIIKQTETGKQLAGLRNFGITERWALQAISREEYEILEKIKEKGMLSKEQRFQLLTFIRKTYMPDFLLNAKNIHQYLISDYDKSSEVFVNDSESGKPTQ